MMTKENTILKDVEKPATHVTHVTLLDILRYRRKSFQKHDKPLLPPECRECWAEFERCCYAKVKGVLCDEAYKTCVYEGQSEKRYRYYSLFTY